MTNDKLYIILTNHLTSQDGVGEGETEEANSRKKKETSLQKYAEHEVMHLIKQTATQMVDFSINQIGNLTGNYEAQRDVSIAKNLATKGYNIGMAAMAGSVAGPVGAAIGAGVALVRETVTDLMSMHDAAVNNKKLNMEIAGLRRKAGLNSTIDGGRGTFE